MGGSFPEHLRALTFFLYDSAEACDCTGPSSRPLVCAHQRPTKAASLPAQKERDEQEQSIRGENSGIQTSDFLKPGIHAVKKKEAPPDEHSHHRVTVLEA